MRWNWLEKDFAATNQKAVHLKPVPEPPIIDQGQDTDIKYQHIVYCKCNRNNCVSYTDHVPIDLVKATNELNGMDWTWKNNGITFINLKNDDDIFCHRLKENKWFVATRVMKDDVYTGLHWVAYPDHESLINTIRLFFEEVAWFEMLDWNIIKWENEIER